MERRRFKIPLKLAVVALTAGLAGCPGSGQKITESNLCPSDYYCTSDAARAFNCTDMATDPYQTDLGMCYPPV